MTYKHIIISRDAAVGVITLNRPEAAGALSQTLAEELASAVDALGKEAAVRAIILTGAGERAFCAGADLKERHGMTEDQWHTQHHALEASVSAILSCPKPIIAAMNGAAFGGGLEIAMACDFIYAASTAKMGLTEAKLGIMCGMGGTQTLPRRIGMARAKELLLTGKHITAEQAYAWGLVNRVIAPELLMPETLATAHVIAANAPLSLTAIKKSVEEGASQPLTQAMQTELHYYHTLLNTHDRHEGINAFNEKRRPQFTGQ